jgi:thiamine biosynthesis lipoprotein
MKRTQLIMGMPVSVEINDAQVTEADIASVFAYFTAVDEQYSPYKSTSEVSRMNAGRKPGELSDDMQYILKLCEQTKRDTKGYFDAYFNGTFDPSGIVKGWAINNAAKLLHGRHYYNFYIDAGGDIQVSGVNNDKQPWRVGIRNPFNREEVIKVIAVTTEGVATSGTAIRGSHIYNPLTHRVADDDIVSLTVIGPNIYEADRFATAAFAMGRAGISFIESIQGFEGYLIDAAGQATLTSGFNEYVVAP